MTENKTQRKLTAILSADVKGYSKLSILLRTLLNL